MTYKLFLVNWYWSNKAFVYSVDLKYKLFHYCKSILTISKQFLKMLGMVIDWKRNWLLCWLNWHNVHFLQFVLGHMAKTYVNFCYHFVSVVNLKHHKLLIVKSTLLYQFKPNLVMMVIWVTSLSKVYSNVIYPPFKIVILFCLMVNISAF